jgi:hypothetical protein
MEGYNRGHEKMLNFYLRIRIVRVFQVFDTDSNIWAGGFDSDNHKDRGNKYATPNVGAL